MISPLSTGLLARWSARHPWIVIAVWVVLLGAAAYAATPESVQGSQLIEQRLRGPEPSVETVIVRATGATADDPAFQAVVRKVEADLTAMKAAVAGVGDYYAVAALDKRAASAMVSADRHTVLIPVTLTPKGAADKSLGAAFVAAVKSQATPGFTVLTVGPVSMSNEMSSTAESDLLKAELIGLPLTLLVLVVVFGALTAAGAPLVLAFVSILVAVGLTAIVGRVFHLSFFVVNMISMIGLAVGIDYALFIIERFREERRRGLGKHEAIHIAGSTASKAVLFSGVTVVLALLGLFIIPMTTFRSLGAGAVMVVVVAVIAMLTLVPALLGLLGDKIDWPRRRIVPTPAMIEAASRPATRGFWHTVTRVVMARPVISVALAGAVLLALAVPYLQLQNGTGGPESLPEGDVKTAYTMLSTDFSAGVLAPVEIVVDTKGLDPAAVQQGLDRLMVGLRADGAFMPTPQVQWSESRDLAVVTIPLRIPANSPEAQAAVWRVRDTLVPQALAATQAPVYVTGTPATNADSVRLIHNYTPFVFAFVLGLSFILLMVAFRSLVVPLKAILMNLLSLGATYGILVVVFQKGLGHRLFGFQHTTSIESWVPIFLFCILFGLSMDYHVFLLSRIREHFDRTRKNSESVAVGLQSTGRIITGAALIMVVVFSVFASGRLVIIQQLGFGLAVAVLIDATLVRSVLVPAGMALLGNANWYLPKWLEWLPELHLEGVPAVARVRESETEGRRP
jgi:RND superfamily putative drug exporter